MKEGKLVCTLLSHKFGVSSVAFSPDSKYLVSIGHQDDGTLVLWDWMSCKPVAVNKYGNQIISIAFSHDSTYFVTAGPRQVRFWYIPPVLPNLSAPITLDVRSALLGSHKEHIFVDVGCGASTLENSSVYAITRKGLLCSFAPPESPMFPHAMDKWVDLKTTRAFSIAVSADHITCACADGVVRIFHPRTLEFIATLPKPPPLGATSLTSTSISLNSKKATGQYPDAIACTSHPDKLLIALYSDHSMYVWNVSEPKKVSLYRSQLAHAGCIWGLQACTSQQEEKAGLPPGTFYTCSSDSTIRFWSISSPTPSETEHVSGNLRTSEWSLSQDMQQIIYTSSDFSPMKAGDIDVSMDFGQPPVDSGVRCCEMSPDGLHVAMGDRQGNLKIFSASNGSLISSIEAHDGEILDLDYSKPTVDGNYLLATGSRDRLIHIFDVNRSYELMRTLDDHSSTITCLRFSANGAKLISGSADKSLVFRSFMMGRYVRDHQVTCFGTVYDVDIDATNKFVVATGGQDKKTSVYNISTGKVVRSYKAQDSSEFVKVCIDPSGLFVASSTTDKTICIFDFYSGQFVGKAHGHSELITGISFTSDCKRLISTSGDGCIFVWRLSSDFVNQMKNRIMEMDRANGKKASDVNRESQPQQEVTSIPTGRNLSSGIAPQIKKFAELRERIDEEKRTSLSKSPTRSPIKTTQVSGLQFTDSSLPAWAKESRNASQDEEIPTSARGKWAQRVSEGGKPIIEKLVEQPIVEDVEGEGSRTAHWEMEKMESFASDTDAPSSVPYSHPIQDEPQDPETLILDSMDDVEISSENSNFLNMNENTHHMVMQAGAAKDGIQKTSSGTSDREVEETSIDVGSFLFRSPAKGTRPTDALRKSMSRQFWDAPNTMTDVSNQPTTEDDAQTFSHFNPSQDGVHAELEDHQDYNENVKANILNLVTKHNSPIVPRNRSLDQDFDTAELENSIGQKMSPEVVGSERHILDKPVAEPREDEASSSVFLDSSADTVKLLQAPLGSYLNISAQVQNKEHSNDPESGSTEGGTQSGMPLDKFAQLMANVQAFQESFAGIMTNYGELLEKTKQLESVSEEQRLQLLSCYKSALLDVQGQLNNHFLPSRPSTSQSKFFTESVEASADPLNQGFAPWAARANTGINQSMASITTSVGSIDVTNALERYSDLLVSLVKEKISRESS
eukprot:TRINITY_DN4493_c0_g1_i2.p1 TRINITY_DN4493_c0_g1~~TRINITY_DN4493_c0_g1_i2.p1  ORF type:complete len:1186 (+),score=184.48 TRINITY_DN4493_c0_g1_i2:927-4484(+)